MIQLNPVKTKNKINSSREAEKESVSDDECVKETHSLLREVHQAIFDEQVFNLVNREAFNQTLGVNVTGIQKNYLQMNIGEGTSVFISLIPYKDEQTADSPSTQNTENAILPLDTLDGLQFPENDKPDTPKKKSVIPDQISCEIYLQQIFHQHVFVKAKDVPTSTSARVSGQLAKEGSGLLAHFCMSLAHRIFSNKVLTETLSMVAHMDPEDSEGCISWWLVIDGRFIEEQKLSINTSDAASETRKFLGHLSLEVLYSTPMDLVSLCNGGGN